MLALRSHIALLFSLILHCVPAYAQAVGELASESFFASSLDLIRFERGWIGVAFTLGVLVAFLRARGLIHHRVLGGVATAILAALGAAAHHVLAGEPLSTETFTVTFLIALFAQAGLAVPVPDPSRRPREWRAPGLRERK